MNEPTIVYTEEQLKHLGFMFCLDLDRQLLMGCGWEEILAFQIEFLTHEFYSPFNDLGRWERYCHYLGHTQLGSRYDGELSDQLHQLGHSLDHARTFSHEPATILTNEDGHPIAPDNFPTAAFNSTKVAEKYWTATGKIGTLTCTAVNGFGRIHIDYN